jgi:hypothetical protein
MPRQSTARRGGRFGVIAGENERRDEGDSYFVRTDRSIRAASRGKCRWIGMA